MALKWIEGFETHRHLSQHARKYSNTTGSSTAISQSGRVLGNAQSGQMIYVTKSLGLNNTWILGWGMFVTANFTASTHGLYLEKASAEQVSIRFSNTAGHFNLIVSRAGTALATTTEDFAYGQWYYFEFKVTARTGTDGAFELRANEVTVLGPTTGVNTAAAGSDGVDVFAIRFGSNIATYLDDIYLCDDTGAINNDFKGDSVIRGGLPNGAGDVQQFTPGTGSTHHTLVDDVATSAPTDGTDVNFDDTNGHKELYDFGNLTTVNGNIYGLMLCSQMAMNAAGSRTLKHVYRDISNVEYNPANFVVNSTTYAEFQDIMENEPITAAAWTETQINHAQFGVEVVS